MENGYGHTMAAAEYDGAANGGHRHPEWTPPQSREEVDEAVLNLSNDIGLILAQLAEDQISWCARTGRAPADYAAWRRRALFAKVHKEGQLRECKRLRAHFFGSADADRASTDHEPPPGLMDRCERVIRAWRTLGLPSGMDELSWALDDLARYLDGVAASGTLADPARPLGSGRGGNSNFEQTRSRVVLGRRP